MSDAVSEQPETHDGAGNRYLALCERAAEFILHHGGAVDEDRLIQYVFGQAGSPSLWRPLLRSILAHDERLVFRPEGAWAVLGQEPDGLLTDLLLDAFVVIDVETTGLRPLRQRVIEVACIRYRAGAEQARFESLINPGTRIPSYISELTGIKDVHVAEAPSFAVIAEEVQTFIGGDLVVGHNVAFDINFLNAELKRVERPSLINERLDMMGMAVRLLRGARKPSLDKVARQVGLEPRKIHRAGVDAALTGEVALRLVDEARRQGVTSIDQLKSASQLIERRPKEGVGRGRSVMDRSLLADIPKRPGCYIMRDQFDHIIYVGKAKNLRDRVSSYYSQPLGYTRKMDGLLESMVRIDIEVVGSELEALLLESQLIRRYEPRYNTALRAFEHYPYIRVDVSSAWPRVMLARNRKDDGARYFGPYRNKGGAKRTVDVINGILPLRTCTRSFKDARSYGHPCLLLDLGRCLGPCVGRADRETYHGLIEDVTFFLDGDVDRLQSRLLAALEEAAEKRDFERAERLRRDMQSVLGIIEDQGRMRLAEREHTLLLVLPSADPACREVFLVIHGRLWTQIRARRATAAEQIGSLDGAEDVVLAEAPRESAAAGDPIADLAGRLDRAWERYRSFGLNPLDNYAVDEANILNRWLFHHHDHSALLRFAGDEEVTPDWRSLAARALALTDSQLSFEETVLVAPAAGNDTGASEFA